MTFWNLCLVTSGISAFIWKLLSPRIALPRNNNFSTLRAEFGTKYYTWYYLCKLHPQFFMCLLNGALPLPVPHKSLPTPLWRESHFQNHLKKCISYSFEFILSLKVSCCLSLQCVSKATNHLLPHYTTWNTWKESWFYLQKLCLILFTCKRKTLNPDKRKSHRQRQWVSYEQLSKNFFFLQKKTLKEDSFHLFLLAIVSCVCT